MSICTRMCAAVGVLALFAAPAQSLTEGEVLQRFLEQSPHARELRARIAATKAELQLRSLFPNPSVSYSREGAGFTEFYEAQQTLPITGRLRYLRKAAAAAVGASEAESKFALWSLRSDVRHAFSALLEAQEREAALANALEDLSPILRILVQREKEGEGSKFDRLRAEREAADLRAERAVALAFTVEARSSLLAFLPKGTEPIHATGVLSSPPPGSATELLERAFTARGDYRAEERQIERFKLEQTAAGKLRFPEPSVSAGLKRAETSRGTESGPVVSVSLPLPLFNRGTTEVERFRAEEERARARLNLIEQQITAQVEGAYQALLIRQRAVESYLAETSAAGAELMRIAQLAYQEGELGILELLDSYRVNRQSQLRLLELRSAAKEAEIELERVVGQEIAK